MQVYLVGGCVRDLFLGRHPNDYDFVVVGATPEQMLALGYKQVGADFPVFLHPHNGSEFALARTERKSGVGYGGFVTEHGPSVTLEDDLSRRDLTMNAMAHPIAGFDEHGFPYWDFHPDYIIDPHGGIADLGTGFLRHVSAAFAEDPVRVLRVARFSARYQMDVHPDTINMMRWMVDKGELDHLDQDRVWKEMSAGLMTAYPERFFRVLTRTNAMWSFEPWIGGAHSQCGGLVNVALADVPLHVRFACIAQNFGISDPKVYEDCRVPVQCKETSQVLWNNLGFALCYEDYKPEEMVHMITRVGGLGAKRNTTLFKDFVQAVRILAPTKRFDENWKKSLDMLERDQKFLASLDIGEFIATLRAKHGTKLPGKDIGDLVHQMQSQELYDRMYNVEAYD